MAKKFTRGLGSMKFGTPTGLSTMPAELTAVEWQKEGTVSINIGEPEKTPIMVEEIDSPIKVLDGGRTIEIVAETYDTSPDSLKLFFGGTVATSTWTPDSTMSAEDKAIEIVTRQQDGKSMKIAIPKASIIASMAGNLTKKEGLTIKYTITPLEVVSGTAPWTWSEV